MPGNSRRKGKNGELEARDFVRTFLHFPDCVRSAQVSGTFAADLLNTGRLHCEVKRWKRIAATDYMKQAVRDADEGKVPVVLMREDQDCWNLVIRLIDIRAFLEAVAHITQSNTHHEEDPARGPDLGPPPDEG